ncbi:Peptidase_S10 domain-containing protein [Cephalotus follicularis]|uniref:Peptidase_S10 domain-containing protein n=1 Tax=Cephalotus follicularis TaxID=3775 RepID=A0A1Q3BJV7_CEPFO|nr:Peptidase_S10 domain-containing protein [Cephalotus follicularis]
MFWWLYRSPYRVEDPSKPRPIILWLQGGPGVSCVGTGNFQEIGPHNFLLDSGIDPVSLSSTELSEGISMKRYSRYLNSLRSAADFVDSFDDFMNVLIRKKLKIIPKNVTWGGQLDDVFTALDGDFMRARISEVDDLLAKGVNMAVYNGQLDVICVTKGTKAWVQKL